MSKQKGIFDTLKGALSPRSVERIYRSSVTEKYPQFKGDFLDNDSKAVYMAFCVDPKGDPRDVDKILGKAETLKRSALEDLREIILKKLKLPNELNDPLVEHHTVFKDTVNLQEHVLVRKEEVKKEYLRYRDINVVNDFNKLGREVITEQEIESLYGLCEIIDRRKKLAVDQFMKSGDPTLLSGLNVALSSQMLVSGIGFTEQEMSDLHARFNAKEEIQRSEASTPHSIPSLEAIPPTFRAGVDNQREINLRSFMLDEGKKNEAKFGLEVIGNDKKFTLRGDKNEYLITVNKNSEGEWSITSTNPANLKADEATKERLKEKVSVVLFNLQTRLESLGVKGVKVTEDRTPLIDPMSKLESPTPEPSPRDKG